MAVQESLDLELARLVAGRDAAVMANPYPVWNRLRAQSPVHRLGMRIFVFRHHHVKQLAAATSDRYAFTFGESVHARRYAALLPDPQARAFHELWSFVGLWMVSRTGDDHDRLRRIAHRVFSARRIARMTHSIQRYASEMIDTLDEHDVVDVMEIADALPLKVVVDLLGCPRDDIDDLHAWSAAIGMGIGAPDPAAIIAAHRAVMAFREYIHALLQEGRGSIEAADLAAMLLDGAEDERLDTEELAAMYVLLLLAGHETTTNLIGHGLHQLLVHRDQWQRLCDDPELWPNAIEELLRFVTPVQYVVRAAAEPHEFAGVRVDVGDTLHPVLAAANRDPAVFDDPDTLDVARPNARCHLSFGYGGKLCLGNTLARTEGVVVLRELARRFPDMELATDRLRYTGSPILRRLAALPVALKAG